MKLLKATLLLSLSLVANQVLADEIEFNFTVTATGYPNSPLNASFIYSGGTTTGDVFTPTGLVTYSIGTASDQNATGSVFGAITPSNPYPGFAFYTDTPYGPSFITGINPILGYTVEVAPYPNNPDAPYYQSFEGNGLSIHFIDESENIRVPDNPNPFTVFGVWTETIIQTPDAASSWVLLAVALGGLVLFSATRRTPV